MRPPSLHGWHDEFRARRIGLGPALRDRLEPSVKAEALGSVGMMIAEHRIAPAAETVERHRYRDRHIDSDHADLDVAGESARDRAALGEDRGAISVLVSVDELDRG